MSQKLVSLKKKIEKLSVCYQIEILRIIHTFKTINISENKNGCFINLTEIPSEALDKLEKYIQYVEVQQKTLTDLEKEKTRLADTFFNGIKETATS